jgi:hypothetical protein
MRPEYRARVDSEDGTPPSVEQLISVAELPNPDHKAYWSHWTSDFDYVYMLFTDPDYENPDPARLTAIYAGERFVLYRINPGKLADVSEPAPLD